jgi:osmotically-inducible protein OsmY
VKATTPFLALAAAGVVLALGAAAFAAAPSPSTSTAIPDSASPNTPMAGALARAQSGVKSAVGETVTTGRIKAAIAADPGMKDTDVSVTTRDGVVTLSGTVKAPEQVVIATNLAQRQEGVNRVESQLTVR